MNQASTRGDDEGVRVSASNQSAQGSTDSINSFTTLHPVDDDPVEAIEQTNVKSIILTLHC